MKSKESEALQTAIRNSMAYEGGERITVASVKESRPGRFMTDQQVRDALNQLTAKGYLRRVSTGVFRAAASCSRYVRIPWRPTEGEGPMFPYGLPVALSEGMSVITWEGNGIGCEIAKGGVRA